MKIIQMAIYLSIFLMQGCSMVKISASNQRLDHPQKFEVNDEIAIISWGEITVNKVEFFPSSFQIRFNQMVVYIDPVEIITNKKADYIFITHSHPDHLSIKDIQRVIKPETKLICPKSVEKNLRKLNCKVIATKPGDNRDFTEIQYTAVPAYNTKPVFLWLKAHPRSKENVGYIIKIGEDIRLYHAGDTDNVAELRDIKNIDIAFIPIGGDNLTMNAKEAAELANTITPKIVVPMHYELKRINELEQFKKLLNKGIEMKTMHSKKEN